MKSAPVERPWLSIWMTAPFRPAAVEGIDADEDEAQVADARIGDEPLHVALAQGHYAAPQDAGDAQPHRDRREAPRGFGEERDGEAEHPVAAGLEEEAREEDRARGGRLGMRVGQPGVEAEGREA